MLQCYSLHIWRIFILFPLQLKLQSQLIYCWFFLFYISHKLGIKKESPNSHGKMISQKKVPITPMKSFCVVITLTCCSKSPDSSAPNGAMVSLLMSWGGKKCHWVHYIDSLNELQILNLFYPNMSVQSILSTITAGEVPADRARIQKL